MEFTMSEEVEISKINVEKNHRKDYGNMYELINSIKEKGILEPLLVDKSFNLIAGARRLRAAKQAGLDKVPVRIIDVDELGKGEIQLVENLQRKNINPIEEGQAFKDYLKESEKDEKYLSQKIGKTEDYIKRRISLLSCDSETKEALIKGRIEIGHAVIISRIADEKKQKTVLKEIQRDGLSVKNMDELLGDEDFELKEAPFSKIGCKDCLHNGGEQTLLTEIGDCLKGVCLKPECYLNKLNIWVKEEKEKLKKKGINVLEEKNLPKGSVAIRSWDEVEYKKAVKNLDKKPDVYAVIFKKDGYSIIPKKEIYRIKEENKTKSKSKVSDVDDKLELNKTEKLQKGIEEFKRNLLIEESKELLSEISLKPVILSHLKEYFDNEAQMDYSKKVKKYFSMNNDELDKELIKLSKNIFWNKETDLLEFMAKKLGFDYENSFMMSKEFLKPYTKDQLIDLIKEFKIHQVNGFDWKKLSKRNDYEKLILKEWEAGQVPKILRGGKK